MIVTGDWGVDELVRGGETEREYGGGGEWVGGGRGRIPSGFVM